MGDQVTGRDSAVSAWTRPDGRVPVGDNIRRIRTGGTAVTRCKERKTKEKRSGLIEVPLPGASLRAQTTATSNQRREAAARLEMGRGVSGLSQGIGKQHPGEKCLQNPGSPGLLPQKAFDGCFQSCEVAEACFICRVRAAAIEFCGEVHLYLHSKTDQWPLEERMLHVATEQNGELASTGGSLSWS